jgi:hypothetical protein
MSRNLSMLSSCTISLFPDGQSCLNMQPLYQPQNMQTGAVA